MLETLDLKVAMDRKEYARQLARCQIQLRELGYQVYLQKRPVVLVFEGWDAAGKGGAIKRITEGSTREDTSSIPSAHRRARTRLDIISIAFGGACRNADRSRSSTAPGMDASWWRELRVSQPRLNGNAPTRRSTLLSASSATIGMILAKFWIHISREEQFRRFEERKATGYKSWKLTDEDWRNREKWDAYEQAVEEMLLKTSTRTAPWSLIEGNDKYHARVKALSVLVDLLSRELKYSPTDPLKASRAGKK